MFPNRMGEASRTGDRCIRKTLGGVSARQRRRHDALSAHGRHGGRADGAGQSRRQADRGPDAGAGAVEPLYRRRGDEGRATAPHEHGAYAGAGLSAGCGGAGESAGGNLAFNVVLAARDQKLPMPVHELLVYPVASTDLTLPGV